MVMDDCSDIINSHVNVTSNGARIAGGTAMEVSPRMELDLAYTSEKVLNLEILMMQVSDMASDYEILMKGPEELLIESIEKAFEFSILSGFLNSEVKEIESFISSLQLDIMDAHKKITEGDCHLDDSLLNIEQSLHLAEESLRSSQDQVIDIRKQSDRIEKFLAFGIPICEELENGECLPMNSKWKLQTAEQQRHFLISLEKSLAREMDFEKRLSESKCNEEELKVKLQFAEDNTYYIEELIEEMMVKMFAAENSVQILLANSKELVQKLKNTSTTQEWEGQLEPQSQLTEASVSGTNNEHKISFSESINLGNVKDLEECALEMRSNAESADERLAWLMKANSDLNDKVGFLKSNGAEKAIILDKKLKESNIQLEHANASLEAIEENQKMLYISINDMEHLIEDLKGKVSKAESRAESAEAKCVLLTGTNLELNEEVSFLRGRLEGLEASLHQADMGKIAAVKDIGNRTRIIIELVKKLTFERERLQLQISVLTNRNKILTEKLMTSESNIPVNYEKVNNSAVLGNINSKGETLAESLPRHFQVEAPASSTIYETKLDPAVAAEDSVPNVELVRTIDATQLNRKYILMAFVLLLLSIISVSLFQLDRS